MTLPFDPADFNVTYVDDEIVQTVDYYPSSIGDSVSVSWQTYKRDAWDTFFDKNNFPNPTPFSPSSIRKGLSPHWSVRYEQGFYMSGPRTNTNAPMAVLAQKAAPLCYKTFLWIFGPGDQGPPDTHDNVAWVLI